jgi:hypothetical protein
VKSKPLELFELAGKNTTYYPASKFAITHLFGLGFLGVFDLTLGLALLKSLPTTSLALASLASSAEKLLEGTSKLASAYISFSSPLSSPFFFFLAAAL